MPNPAAGFFQEAQAASALNHPNIVTVYDIGSENGIDFIVMEYVNGSADGHAASGRAAEARAGGQVRDANRRRPFGGPSVRHHSPRSEAGQYRDHPRLR